MMAELDRTWLTTMLTTDTTLEVLACLTSFLNSHLNQLTNTLLIENLEWVNIKNLLFQVAWQEASNVVAALTEGHLS